MYECKIAEKLVELRTSKGVTQEDVAQSLSISNKTVSKWENGASTPDLPMIPRPGDNDGRTSRGARCGLCISADFLYRK